jgi:Ca2+-binding EF-hand superfamily protein
MTKRIRERNPENEMRRAFALLDTENKGYLNEADLKTIHKTLGLDASGIGPLISEFSSNGKIDFETFCVIQKQGAATTKIK